MSQYKVAIVRVKVLGPEDDADYDKNKVEGFELIEIGSGNKSIRVWKPAQYIHDLDDVDIETGKIL